MLAADCSLEWGDQDGEWRDWARALALGMERKGGLSKEISKAWSVVIRYYILTAST